MYCHLFFLQIDESSIYPKLLFQFLVHALIYYISLHHACYISLDYLLWMTTDLLVIVCLLEAIFWNTTLSGSAALANSMNASHDEKGILCLAMVYASLYGAVAIMSCGPRNCCTWSCPFFMSERYFSLSFILASRVMLSTESLWALIICFLALSFLTWDSFCLQSKQTNFVLSSEIVTRNSVSHDALNVPIEFDNPCTGVVGPWIWLLDVDGLLNWLPALVNLVGVDGRGLSLQYTLFLKSYDLLIKFSNILLSKRLYYWCLHVSKGC